MTPSLGLDYEMTFAERIEGPLGPTTGSPSRLCWQIAEATLTGPRISAALAMPGTDWIRVETSGDVTVTITNLPAGTRHLNLPHLDTAALIGVVGCVAGASLQANLEAAMVELHRRITGEGGLTPADAFHLTGATARVVINQCVSPPDFSAVYVGVPRIICAAAQDTRLRQYGR
jgi:hypothetical protein